MSTYINSIVSKLTLIKFRFKDETDEKKNTLYLPI